MRKSIRLTLAAVLLLTGASAVWGGYMLVVGAWEMDPAWLEHTPFDGWVVPGLATVLFPGLGEIAAGVAVFARLPHRRVLATAAGFGLIAWVAVELAWLQVFHPVMHPLIFCVGIVVVLMARLLCSGEPAGSEPSAQLVRH